MTTYASLASELEKLIVSETSPDESSYVEIAKLAEACAKKHKDSDWYHLAALAWYENPSTDSRRSQKIRELEARALQLDPEYQYALQYMAYLCFDEGEYDNAIEYLNQIDNTFFERLDQRWRIMKNAELYFVSRTLVARNCDENAYRKLLSDYANFSDDYGPPNPNELARMLTGEPGRSIVNNRLKNEFRQLVEKLDCSYILDDSFLSSVS